jgi:hypothetical protein
VLVIAVPNERPCGCLGRSRQVLVGCVGWCLEGTLHNTVNVQHRQQPDKFGLAGAAYARPQVPLNLTPVSSLTAPHSSIVVAEPAF